jgi:capsular exopolysaccharide synthesis family protein
VFGLDNLIGISDMIVDHTNTAAAIRSVSSIPNLSIITGGTLAPNPSELLGSNSMRLLMSKLRSQYDRIILDSPPVMVFSDGLVLSRLADGVIFVVWGAMTGRDNIKKSVQAISGVNSRILGIVLNNIDLTSKSSYYYYHPYYNYHYYYGEKGEEKMAKKGRNTSDTGTR